MFTKETYSGRRAALKKRMKSGLILILGNNQAPMNYAANTYPFRQDSTFLYFFGLDLPGLAGVIDIDNNREILFGDDFSLEDIIWTGPQPTIDENAKEAGITITHPFDKLSEIVSDAVKKNRPIHFTPPYRYDNIQLLAELLNIHPRDVANHTSNELIRACIDLRSIKEPCEIEEMENHMNVALAMHVTAMKMARPGVPEQKISGTLEGISMSHGGMVAFPVICSVRGETLHNHDHSNILKENDLLLVDAGSETPRHYATDHTRTTPVSGKFTEIQRAIYQIVLNANNNALEACRPGVPFKNIHMLACRTIAKGLKETGLMKGDIDEAIQEGAHALFMPHGLGHMIGLDAHDMEDYGDTLVGYDEEIKRSDQFGLAALRLGRKLQAGFTVTIEPGIYFIPNLIDDWKARDKFARFINYDEVEKYKGFGGIRLEDDVLITDQGARIMGNRIPVSIAEVEEITGTGF